MKILKGILHIYLVSHSLMGKVVKIANALHSCDTLG